MTRHPPVRLLLAALPLLASCASAGSAPAPAATPEGEDPWAALHRPRPEPLAGAPTVAVAELLLLEDRPWGLDAPIPTALGLSELVSAGLLRRRDVRLVERRRFSEAAERERRGLPRPDGAPPVGTSEGAEWLLAGTVAPLGDSIYLDLRLIHTGTGANRSAWRTALPRDAEPAAVSRVVVGTLLETLGTLGLRPRWTDPEPLGALATYRDTGVPPTAFAAFMRGVAAEDRYDWEGARRAYEEARELGGPGFFEPAAALARVARLRAGGSLGSG